MSQSFRPGSWLSSVTSCLIRTPHPLPQTILMTLPPSQALQGYDPCSKHHRRLLDSCTSLLTGLPVSSASSHLLRLEQQRNSLNTAVSWSHFCSQSSPMIPFHTSLKVASLRRPTSVCGIQPPRCSWTSPYAPLSISLCSSWPPSCASHTLSVSCLRAFALAAASASNALPSDGHVPSNLSSFMSLLQCHLFVRPSLVQLLKRIPVYT